DEANRAGEPLLRLAEALGGFADVVEDAQRELQQRLAGWRDLDLALDAPEERFVEFGFEQEDLTADGGLGDVKAAAGAGEGPRLGHRLENLQLSQVHVRVEEYCKKAGQASGLRAPGSGQKEGTRDEAGSSRSTSRLRRSPG